MISGQNDFRLCLFVFSMTLICKEPGIKKKLQLLVGKSVSKHPFKGSCVKKKILEVWVM